MAQTNTQEDKCKGCQSFCMLGKQVVMDNLDLTDISEGDLGWTKWKNLTSGANGTTITSDDALSATNHNGLVNFIKKAYEAGDVNCSKIEESISQLKNADKLDISLKTSKSCPTQVTGNTVKTDDIINSSHFNNFLYAITKNTLSTVTIDPNKEALETANKDISGPVCGNPSVAIEAIFTSQDITQNGKPLESSLIKAQPYIDLAEKAEKLLFHPHQCNICNIYEGGELSEIIHQVGNALYDLGSGAWYSWTRPTDSFSIESMPGQSFRCARRDCSGYVGCCLAIYSLAQGKSSSFNGDHPPSGHYCGGACPHNLYNLQDEFSLASGESSCPGIMIFSHSEHIEISDEEGRIWSGGGGVGGCYNGQANDCHERDGTMMGCRGGKTSSGCPAVWKYNMNKG